MVEVYTCKLPANRETAVLDKLLFHVSKERQSRLKRFVKIDDAYRSLVGDLLVRFALTERYGAIDGELKIETNEYGKPFLCEYSDFHYNISHSGDYVVCAVHVDAVGVDIEYIGPFNLHLAKELFTEEEYQEVQGNENSLAAFYDIWTLKESYIKAVGQGLSKSLKEFSIKKDRSNDSIRIKDVQTGKEMMDYVCRQYKADDNYRLSVCAHHANAAQFRSLPISVTFQEVCERLGMAVTKPNVYGGIKIETN